MFKRKPLAAIISPYIMFAFTSFVSLPQALAEDTDLASLEEVHIWGTNMDRNEAGYTNPTSVLTTEDMTAINAATTEDLVKYEPGLVIRRRFIGDSNGTLGLRGSNMFQTSRSMVFADGVPLHYLLQSRWNGAPRWTMASASEIAQIEVIYGPFSAEYSGNAMGGVVLIETAIPQEQEFHADVSLFSQDFDAYGFDDSVSGYKGFLSYGNKQGGFSYYLSYNRLDNEGQPQTFYYGGNSSNTNPSSVTGLVRNVDPIPNADGSARERWYFGDTGIVDTLTDNYKIKLGYESGNWSSLLNVAYEDRYSSSTPTSYLRDTNGNTVWAGDVSENDIVVNVPVSRLNISELQRDSLSIGLRLRGELSERTTLEANINQFDILKDDSASSASNPAYVGHTLDGQVNEYDNSGWRTAELKLRVNDFAIEGMNLTSGVRYEAYELNFNVYDSDNYRSANKTRLDSSSGGKTNIAALFTQMNWKISEAWDLSLGARYEKFNSKKGYFSDDDVTTPQLDLVATPNTSDSHISPKFSLGYRPREALTLRYSLAKAYRFPIVEELFSQYQAYNAISEANPELKPEDGLHHNIMLDYSLDSGYLRLNFFAESIKNVIESQSETITSGPNTGVSVRTFVPIDQVDTQGIEFIANQYNMFFNNFDVRFNLTWTNSDIVKNNPDASIEGNVYPRMPKWRANLLSTYHVNDRWDISANLQYASDSFGRNDNTDTQDNVYGAQDGYSRIGLKSSYKFNPHFKVGIGIDNLTNEIAYVAHPWPGRTVYLNFAYDL